MSGINFIRRFVINQMTKKSDNGIMITLPDRKKVDLNTSITAERLMRNGIDPNAITSPQQVENILNQLNKPRVIPADSPEGRGITNALLRRGQVVDLQGRKIDTSKPIVGGKQMDVEPVNNKFVDYTISSMNKMEPIDAMKEANKILKREGPYKDLTTQQAKKILDDTEDHIFERNIKPKETDITLDEASSTLDQEIKNAYNKAVREGKFKGTEEDFRNKIDDMMDEDFAAGGRVGLKSGMSRRAFLQLMGGVGAGIGAAKTGILKMFGKGAGKQAAKEIISTPNVPGKPEWFDSLVNKVITQGDDVSKNFATQDRQVVHRVFLDKDGKVIDAKQADKLRQEGNVYDVEDITVTRNLDDGQIRVNYYSDKNMGAGDVELIYKPGQADEMTKGKTPDTFEAVEAEPRVVNFDGDIEYDGENLVNNIDDLYSDTNKLKQFARGDKKPTLKEFIESRKKKAIVEEVNSSDVGATEYLSNKYGEPIYDLPDVDPPEFASGGIARMLGE